MYRIAIYTAIFGGKDVLCDPLNYEVDAFIDYYCFTDDRSIQSDTYQVIMKDAVFLDMTKNARFYKVLGSEELKRYDYVVWHDGNIQVDHSKIGDLISCASTSFLSTFKHPSRNCFYEEASVCIKRNKDFPFKILKQVISYYKRSLPSNAGLFETGIMVTNTSCIQKDFYEIWWSHISNYSKRDQLSLGFLIWKERVKIGILPGSGTNNPFSVYYPHRQNVKSFGNRYFRFLLVRLISLIRNIAKLKSNL